MGAISKIKGNQFALSFLGRLQYPLMGSERFTRGRIVPFLMFGPSVVWSTRLISDTIFFDGGSQTSTNFGLVAEVGVEFFIMPATVHRAVLPLPSCLWAELLDRAYRY